MAIVKVAGRRCSFRGPARCFDCEEDAFRVVELASKDGDVLIIRYEGPKGGPACARCFRRRLRFTAKDPAKRLSRTGASPAERVAVHRPSDRGAAVGGPIGLVKDGDMISIDDRGTLDLEAVGGTRAAAPSGKRRQTCTSRGTGGIATKSASRYGAVTYAEERRKCTAMGYCLF
jgi:dihydroxy-acid dehydratase